MIERLMNEESRYGEPDFSRTKRQITEICQKLNEILDEDGQRLVDSLTAAYIHQNNLILKDVFKSGFCAAMELMMEFLNQKS